MGIRIWKDGRNRSKAEDALEVRQEGVTPKLKTLEVVVAVDPKGKNN